MHPKNARHIDIAHQRSNFVFERRKVKIGIPFKIAVVGNQRINAQFDALVVHTAHVGVDVVARNPRRKGLRCFQNQAVNEVAVVVELDAEAVVEHRKVKANVQFCAGFPLQIWVGRLRISQRWHAAVGERIISANGGIITDFAVAHHAVTRPDFEVIDDICQR